MSELKARIDPDVQRLIDDLQEQISTECIFGDGAREETQSAKRGLAKIKAAFATRPTPERHNELREALRDLRSIAKGARDSTASENRIFRVLAESVLEIATAALAEQAAPVKEGV